MKNKYIYFIGERPSVHNTDPNTAFIGSLSGVRLFSWISQMNLNLKEIKLINSTQVNEFYKDLEESIIVALGLVASRELNRRNLKHMRLPHPSGRNRQLNNKNWLNEQLVECKQYIEKNR
jgi:hypothetical protein